jgi:hypothetical protein
VKKSFAALAAVAALTAGCGGSNMANMPKSPTLMSVEKMSGGLMVTWKNNEAGCAAVEGERKTATEGYRVVFSVNGDATSKHDDTATADTTYTYRLRCMKGDMPSEYCPELSGNPVR